MKTMNELKAEFDTLTAQRDQHWAQYWMTKGYLQRIEEEIAAQSAPELVEAEEE